MYIVLQGEVKITIDLSKKVLSESELRSLEIDLELTNKEKIDLSKAIHEFQTSTLKR